MLLWRFVTKACNDAIFGVWVCRNRQNHVVTWFWHGYNMEKHDMTWFYMVLCFIKFCKIFFMRPNWACPVKLKSEGIDNFCEIYSFLVGYILSGAGEESVHAYQFIAEMYSCRFFACPKISGDNSVVSTWFILSFLLLVF